MDSHEISRRMFLAGGAAAIVGSAIGARPAEAQSKPAQNDSSQDVLPIEDMMREHGLLRRLMLIFDRARLLLNGQENLPPDVLNQAVDITQKFIQNYHEKLEEDSVFPAFEKAHQQVELVKVLREQHEAGRKLTEWLKANTSPLDLEKNEVRDKIGQYLNLFTRMYRPHAAREDTVLYPAFRGVLKGNEYDQLGDQFEAKETQLFGEGGFEKMVVKVALLETSLQIQELSQFTPPS